MPAVGHVCGISRPPTPSSTQQRVGGGVRGLGRQAGQGGGSVHVHGQMGGMAEEAGAPHVCGQERKRGITGSHHRGVLLVAGGSLAGRKGHRSPRWRGEGAGRGTGRVPPHGYGRRVWWDLHVCARVRACASTCVRASRACVRAGFVCVWGGRVAGVRGGVGAQRSCRCYEGSAAKQWGVEWGGGGACAAGMERHAGGVTRTAPHCHPGGARGICARKTTTTTTTAPPNPPLEGGPMQLMCTACKRAYAAAVAPAGGAPRCRRRCRLCLACQRMHVSAWNVEGVKHLTRGRRPPSRPVPRIHSAPL